MACGERKERGSFLIQTEILELTELFCDICVCVLLGIIYLSISIAYKLMLGCSKANIHFLLIFIS